MSYEIVKALHIISVIAWMAGMLYLPRLMVYHADAQPGTDKSETFKIMERRLLKAIINPAMIATWFFGLWMVYLGELWTEAWMYAKFVLVLLMSACHGYLAGRVREFASDSNRCPRGPIESSTRFPRC